MEFRRNSIHVERRYNSDIAKTWKPWSLWQLARDNFTQYNPENLGFHHLELDLLSSERASAKRGFLVSGQDALVWITSTPPESLSIEWRSPVFLLFVDFERAFDTIKRNSIWSYSKRRGVPQNIVEFIKSLYRDADCSVGFKEKLSRKIKINPGVRQGRYPMDTDAEC